MGLVHWVRLAMTDGLGPILTTRVVECAGGAEAAVRLSERALRGIEGIGSSKASAIYASLAQAGEMAEEELRKAEAMGVTILCREDSAYPALLKEIHDPPAVLYMRGTLEPRDLNAIGMVGSRRCTTYGREQADRFAGLLAGAGFCVISGGARGIDSAAHRGAMLHPQGRTIAVLGSGVDVAYPPENKALFDQIATRGAVLSEFPLGTPPNAENFPRRNRIVSGMSRGVLVIEADIRSGALITARLAGEEQGRTVFALPGRVDSQMSLGTLQLIRDGATMVTKLEDIIEGLGPLPESVREPTLFEAPSIAAPGPVAETSPVPMAALSPAQQTIYDALEVDAQTVDQLVERTGLEVAVVLRELTLLSLKGLARRVDGHMYVRSRPRN